MNIILKNGSGEIEEKKSRFICHIFKIKSEEEAGETSARWKSPGNCPLSAPSGLYMEILTGRTYADFILKPTASP
mgnify:CR=1 FL=1